MSRRQRGIRIVQACVAVTLIAMVALVAIALRSGPPPIRRVVVIHFDTTRTDDFGCYGGIPRTPHVDAVAAAGMRFTNAIAPVPMTSPSIASFMTGRLANRNGVYNTGGRLLDDFTTLAEMLRDEGFVTAGFTGNLSVARLGSEPSRSAGFEQGFDVYEGIQIWPEIPAGVEANTVPHALGAPLTDAATRFVDAHADEEFFLWMLYLDPHAPYMPPEPYGSMYLDHPDLLADTVEVPAGRIHTQAYDSTRRFKHEYVARHMGEVTMVDRLVGPLLARVSALPGRTLIVITADHGESLGDDDYWFDHGANIRHPCVNVPLIITCEGMVPQGASDALVANIDIAPTILELLDIPADPLDADGRSLVPAFHTPDPWPRRLIPIQAYRGRVLRGVRAESWSMHSAYEKNTGRFLGSRLYDLAADPGEATDVAGQRSDIMQVLVGFENDWFLRESVEEEHLRDHPEMIERLRALGYLK